MFCTTKVKGYAEGPVGWAIIPGESLLILEFKRTEQILKSLLLLTMGIPFLWVVTEFQQIFFDSGNHMRSNGPFLNGRLPSRAPVPWKFARIHNDLEFGSNAVTRIERVPGTSQFAVLGKDGRVWVFDGSLDSSTARLVLDLRNQVEDEGEAGLTGIAFHPEFNRPESPHRNEVFLFYTQQISPEKPIYDRLVKYAFTDDLARIDLETEEVLIQQYDRSTLHNSGDLFFDKAGYLYLTLGDEGFPWSGDLRNSQSIDHRLFGGIIRIDVDMDSSRSHPVRRSPQQNENRPENFPPTLTQNYFIPDSNPWLDEGGKYLEEFYAIGLRNPYSAVYDTLSGQIWVGDVGDLSFEELSVISKGDNGQWPYREGNLVKQPIPENLIGNERSPIHSYDRSEGSTIIAGLMYRGDYYPDLTNKFILADFTSGKVWAFDSTSENRKSLIFRGFDRIVDFFIGLDGSIQTLRLNGEIHRLESVEIVEETPEKLSQLDVFHDLSSLAPKEGILPYDINTPLWSDGASKRRWMVLPEDSTIGFEVDKPWSFPAGTVFIKHFELPVTPDSTKNLETRFFVIDLEKSGYGITYRWNQDDSEAFLVAYEQSPSDTFDVGSADDAISQIWNYPSRGQCLQCHNSPSMFVLGLKSAQLNRPVMGDEGRIVNQIAYWNDHGLFQEEDIPGNLPRMVGIKDEEESLEHRVSSYLDANCSHCHRPDGINNDFDGRFVTPFGRKGIIGKQVRSRNSDPDNQIVHPGNEDRSELWVRDASLNEIKMPPIAKTLRDESYLEVLKDWIRELEPLRSGSALVFYPNPVTGPSFTLRSEGVILDVQIYGLDGRLISIEIDDSQSNHVTIMLPGGLIPGVYGLACRTDRGVETAKLVITR